MNYYHGQTHLKQLDKKVVKAAFFTPFIRIKNPENTRGMCFQDFFNLSNKLYKGDQLSSKYYRSEVVLFFLDRQHIF